MNRREVMVGLAAAVSGTAVAQTVSGAVTTGPAGKASGDFASGSTVFAYSDVVPAKLPNGSERITGFHGTLPTGEAVSMHESWVPAGTPPVALHVIHHTEMTVVLEGELEFMHDGAVSKAKAGDVLYIANGTNHAVKNVGAGTARYMVIQVGGDTK